MLVSSSKPIAPGGRVIIQGEHLGASAGVMRLQGEFPGTSVDLNVVEWTDTQVRGVLPSVRGAPDHRAEVVVVTGAGLESNPLDIQFVASRETILLPRYALSVECAGGTDEDNCSGPRVADSTTPEKISFSGGHLARDLSLCCLLGTVGTDRYSARLANGWTFSKLDVTQLRYPFFQCYSGRHQSLLFDAEGFEVGSSDLDLSIRWWTTGACSYAGYVGMISITGPAGVPLR